MKNERNNIFNSGKVLYSFKPVKEIEFPDSSNCISTYNKKEKTMNNLVIKPDKYTIYQISKEDIQELKHIPEQDIEGFSYLVSPKSCETFTPIYHQKEEWYVIVKNGKKIDLTKKQYNIIKSWFKGE